MFFFNEMYILFINLLKKKALKMSFMYSFQILKDLMFFLNTHIKIHLTLNNKCKVLNVFRFLQRISPDSSIQFP